MYCPSCGSIISGHELNCPSCGASLSERMASASEPIILDAVPVSEGEPRPAPQPQPQPQQPGFQPQPEFPPQPQQPYGFGSSDQQAHGSQSGGYGYAAPGVPHYTGGQHPQSGFQPTYAQGCVSAAVADVRSAPLPLGRIWLLGLVQCVPILNFVVTGYALNWAREVPYGGRTSLPGKIVTGGNFEIGFYAFLIALVVGIVSSLAAGLVGAIPIVGVLSVVVVIFGSMFQYLLTIRMGINQALGEGFKVADAWRAMQRNWTGLLCAVFVPSLVCLGVVFVASLVYALVVVLLSAIIATTALDVLGMAVSFFLGVITLVFAVACGACIAMTVVVTTRALAHWVARYAPEWPVSVPTWSA